MSDNIVRGELASIPATPRHWRSTMWLLYAVYVVPRTFRYWRERLARTEPEKAKHFHDYIWASILPSRAKEYANLFVRTYHAPPWRVALPLIVADLLILAVLYAIAYRLDYRFTFKLRKGITISGPRLYRKAREFEKAIAS